MVVCSVQAFCFPIVVQHTLYIKIVFCSLGVKQMSINCTVKIIYYKSE